MKAPKKPVPKQSISGVRLVNVVKRKAKQKHPITLMTSVVNGKPAGFGRSKLRE